MKRTLIVALAVFALASVPSTAKAQWTVFDPTNYANAVLRYRQLLAQLQQLQATYTQIVNQYNLAVQMARSIPNMGSRYLAMWSPWRYANAQDQYGNTATWIDGINSGIVPVVLRGYQRATNTLQTYSDQLLAGMAPDERERVLSHSATIELADGAAQNAMATIGAIRADAVATTNTISNIQNDSLSDKPNLNTEVGVLNKVNATTLAGLQTAQDTNKLLVAILEEQTLLAKHLRDAETNATNADIDRRLNFVNLDQQLEGGIGTTLTNYRLP